MVNLDKDLKNTVRSNDSNLNDLRRNITIDSVGVIQSKIKRETETDPEASNQSIIRKEIDKSPRKIFCWEKIENFE